MAATIVFEELFEMPLDLASLAEFRRWALSKAFPERGRIDFVGGRIEVDMSPEDLFTHGNVKIEIVGVLWQRVKAGRLGHLFTDRTRVSTPAADLSVEPDVVFVSEESIDGDRVRLVPRTGGDEGRYAEIEGAPDLTVEIVSDSSSIKDTRRLPVAYHRAGVREFWLIDARKDQLAFRIHRRGESAFDPVTADGEGFQASEVFACRFRLDRARDRRGHWSYSLVVRE
jgi:Uma2 family endonuclease